MNSEGKYKYFFNVNIIKINKFVNGGDFIE